MMSVDLEQTHVQGSVWAALTLTLHTDRSALANEKSAGPTVGYTQNFVTDVQLKHPGILCSVLFVAGSCINNTSVFRFIALRHKAAGETG
jgi:hypothetical protein